VCSVGVGKDMRAMLPRHECVLAMFPGFYGAVGGVVVLWTSGRST